MAAAAEDREPFFIVGAGRSGTTLLRLMLIGHSQIEIPPETWFILPLVRRLPRCGVLTQSQVQEAIDIVTGDYRWPDMGMTANSLKDQVFLLPAPRLVGIINIVYQQHLFLASKRRLGDKTPPYIEIVLQLKELYPKAKFIHLIRDGRDVAASYIELKWYRRGSRCYERDFEWTRSLRLRESYRGTPVDNDILDIKYEELVSDPECTLRRVCAFIDESFESDMLEWSNRTVRVPAREIKIHNKLNQPLTPEAIGKWRKRLSAFECFIVEACLYRDLREWGYELRYSSMVMRPFLRATGSILIAMGPLLVRIVPFLKRRGLLPKDTYI